jgi:hypothetical protein
MSGLGCGKSEVIFLQFLSAGVDQSGQCRVVVQGAILQSFDRGKRELDNAPAEQPGLVAQTGGARYNGGKR